MKKYITTGSIFLDRVLNGGLPRGEVTLLYGEAETGKTSLAIQCAVNSARMGFKTLYVDCEGAFSPQRLGQIASRDVEYVSSMIILLRPSTFQEQAEIIDSLEKVINKRFGLIIFDTITSLYRLELAEKNATFSLNRELNRQVAILTEIAKTTPLSVLLLSQVRSLMQESGFTPVATRILKFWSNSVIRLSRTDMRGVIRVSVEKISGTEAKTSFLLIIRNDGIRDYEPRGDIAESEKRSSTQSM